MVELPPEKYVGCTCEILRGFSVRRQLYSSSTCHVLPVITSLFKELYSSDDVKKVVPSVESERCTKIFLCMRCFWFLEKLLKLENEKNNLEKSLKAGFVKVGQFINLQQKSEASKYVPHTPTHIRAKKRLREISPLAAIPSKKRRGPDTPTRNIIQHIHAPGTPYVLVIFFMMLWMVLLLS